MATLIIKSTDGNITGANAFNTIEAGASATQQTRSASTTTTTSYVYSSAFTGTNTDVCDGLLLYCNQTTATGTVSVALSEDNGTTATREVTVNAVDLNLFPGWVFFKFGSTLTLDGGTDYKVGIKGSSAGNATFFRDGTAGNWTRILRLTATATAAAGDVLYIVGDHTGTGAVTARTVTMIDTASTDYGTGVAGAADNGIEIGDGGVLTFGTSAATNYTLKVSGSINVWANGTLNIGTTGTPIPRGSTATLTLDCGANVDFGLIINQGGTFNSQGLSRTSGKNIYYCKLNTDEAIASTSLGVDTDTGWLDNDEIAVASTTRTNTECEAGALNGAAGASSLTVDGFAGAGGGLAAAHSGTSPIQAEIILLTRSIKIQGASGSLQGYVSFASTSIVDIDWTEFKWLGSNTALKRGIDISTTTGSCNIQYSSAHDFLVANSRGFFANSATNDNITISNCGTWNIQENHLVTTGTSGSTYTYSNIICIKSANTSFPMVTFHDVKGTISSITCVGAGGSTTIAGMNISGVGSAGNNVIGTINNLTVHSSSSAGIRIGLTASSANNITSGTISNITSWRNSGSGIIINADITSLILDTVTAFGNGSNNISIQNDSSNGSGGMIGELTIISATLNGDTTFSTTDGIFFITSTSARNPIVAADMRFINLDSGTVSGIKTAHTSDINLSSNGGYYRLVLNNSKLASSTELASQTNLAGYISSQKHDQTAGSHKTWRKYGTITTDTTISRTASPSERLTPTNASNKLISGTRQVAVGSGFALTPSVYVRESVVGDGTDYNGNRIRLIVKRNDAVGITADTVLDTATVSSEGAFEQLTGTTATTTDDGVLEFYVDCDGTTGWINVDDWSVT